MDAISRDKLKQKGIKRLGKSFKYALEGLVYAFKFEQNIWVHTLATILVIIFGFAFEISSFEWLIIVLAIGLVIATELINTSIEAVVDLTCKEINPIAKIAKDTAASAVMIFAFTAVVAALIIFVPKILTLI